MCRNADFRITVTPVYQETGWVWGREQGLTLLGSFTSYPPHPSHGYLSGAFSTHSDLVSAITIGMFPDIPREKYSAYANTSLDSARILFLDRDRHQELTDNHYCIQFASIPDFLMRKQAAKILLHTDLSRYPVIARKLKR